MKKTGSLVLVIIMLLTSVPLSGFVGLDLFPEVAALDTNEYQVGDHIQFGTYPQTQVEENTKLKNAAQAATWKSYNYYSNNQLGDWMQFADFFSNGKKYRAVKFTQYRPVCTSFSPSETYQGINGYEPNHIYYFKYEPLTWRILDPSLGYILCEKTIDSQAFQNTVCFDSSTQEYYRTDTSFLANNYEYSSIRTWLNVDFYETAFSSAQRNRVRLMTLLDDAYTVNDKVFLLAYQETRFNEYGFEPSTETSLSACVSQGTDYAKCQGLCYSDKTWWWTRSADSQSDEAHNVADFKVSFYNAGGVRDTSGGIRPACCLKELTNDTLLSDNLYSETIGLSVWGDDEPLILPMGVCTELDTTVIPENEEILWLTSDPSVATVDENGLVSSVREGIAFITLVTKSNKYSGKQMVIVRSNGTNDYSLGEETYSFKNFPRENQIAPCTCTGGHCFGMAVTSSMYYLGLLNRTEVFGNNESLYDKVFNVDINKETVNPICQFHHSQQIRNLMDSKVAGGSYDTLSARILDAFGLYQDSSSFDWPSMVQYVKNHKYDKKGKLIIRFWGRDTEDGEISGHGVNFLRYEIVNGEERIYAYDNNYPDIEVYFSRDKEGNIHESPKCCFDYSIDSIGLFDTYKFYEAAEKRIDIPVIYSNKGVFVVENVIATTMCGDDAGIRQVMYEIPEDQKEVRIVPLTDHVEFTYKDQMFFFDREDENTIGILKLAESEEDTGTLTIINDPKHHVHIYSGELTTEPTCTVDGKVTCTCTRCDETKIETIPALGHYDNDDDNVCDNCGETINSVFNDNQCGDNIYWFYDDNTATLNITGTGEMWDYYGDTPPWRDYLDSLQTIVVGDGVSSIGNYCFENAINLESISLPNSVLSIGDYCFGNAFNLTSITLGDSLEEIGTGAFSRCTRLVDISIPNTVKSIGVWAFEDCVRLKEIHLPSGLTQISEGLFIDCASLELVEIPESVESFQNASNLFAYCLSLRAIKNHSSVALSADIEFEIRTVPEIVGQSHYIQYFIISRDVAAEAYAGILSWDEVSEKTHRRADEEMDISFEEFNSLTFSNGGVNTLVRSPEDILHICNKNSLDHDYCKKNGLPYELICNGHVYGDWVVINEATTEAEGLMQRECIYCEAVVSKSIPKITTEHQHTYTSTITKEPTCKEEGVMTYICTVCDADTEGHKKTESISKNPANHAPYGTVLKNKVEAICTKKGYTGDTVCNGCGVVVSSGKSVDPLGHTEPDSHGKCERCGKTIADVCKWCGKTHEGFFQGIIGFFHKILAAILGAKY